jgi:hypothetical protein
MNFDSTNYLKYPTKEYFYYFSPKENIRQNLVKKWNDCLSFDNTDIFVFCDNISKIIIQIPQKG